MEDLLMQLGPTGCDYEGVDGTGWCAVGKLEGAIGLGSGVPEHGVGGWDICIRRQTGSIYEVAAENLHYAGNAMLV